VTLQVQQRCCHACSPFPGATKNGTSMQRGPDSYSGSLATAGRAQPHHDRPLRGSDKSARAATFSFIMVRRRRCLTPIALSIDVVVTDLELPGSCDGVALTRHINARFPALPVIVASGRPPPTWDGLTIAGFYQKPYDPDAISRRVAALCGDGTDTAQRDQGRG